MTAFMRDMPNPPPPLDGEVPAKGRGRSEFVQAFAGQVSLR